LVGTFLKQLTIKYLFSFPPHPMFVSALPVENRTNEILLFYPMRYDYLINKTHKTHFVHISNSLVDILSSCSFLNRYRKIARTVGLLFEHRHGDAFFIHWQQYW